MSHRRERIWESVSRRTVAISTTGVLLALLAVPAVTREGSANPLPRRATTSDTLRLRSVLSKGPRLDTEYLDRLREPERNSDAQTASRYAKRFGISLSLARTIIESARAEGLDPELGFRLVRVESGFSARAVSPMGALGLTQLMPGTARVLDRSLRSRDAILEPRTNLRVGFRYLRQMIREYDGDVRLGLLAYNRGPVAVKRALRRGRDPENGYSHKVLGTRSSNPYTGKGLLN